MGDWYEGDKLHPPQRIPERPKIVEEQPRAPIPITRGSEETHRCKYRTRCEELERAIHILQLENKVLRNPDLKQVAPTLLGLAKELDDQERRGAVNSRGYVEVPTWKLARRVELSPSTVSKHMKKCAEIGLVEKVTERERLPLSKPNRTTGEARDYESHVMVRAQGPLVDRLIELANYRAPVEHKSAWGGKRVRCPDHPNAPVVKNTVYQCTECQRIIKKERDVLDDLSPDEREEQAHNGA